MLTSKQKLKQAESLYEEKKYTEALKLLDELEQENPGEKKVAYGRAMCLARLGNYADAMLLCDELLARYRDEKAKVLKEKIMQWAEEANALPHTLTREPQSPASIIWEYAKRVLWLLLFLFSIGMPFIGWWGLMITINKDWVSVSLEGTLAFALLWPLLMQGLFWLSLQRTRSQTFGDTKVIAITNWFIDTALLTFLNLIPIIGWFLGAWWLAVKRELSFSSSFAIMILNFFLFWLSFLGIVASIGLGGWAWILAPYILKL
ncbi:MAG TPA: tetratricopeptide repeat protein [Candidatus Hydrogenedens sp.]|jgi:tetratricopeptide (TPR) repeat protein|nr:tetratricopeptide repeat protein [Candidatus Hydrogenedens sp.]